MKLTIIGPWAPYPSAEGACPGYLLEISNRKLLLDCGNGVISKLQRYIKLEELDLVVLSHWHPDHHADLQCLRHARAGKRREDAQLTPIVVLAPKNPADLFGQYSGYTEAFQFKDSSSLPNYKLDSEAGLITLIFKPTNHPMFNLATKVSYQGQTLVYVGDTGWDDSLIPFLEGVDLVLIEASLQDKDIEFTKLGHLTARQAAALCQRAGVKKVVLTHFWPEHDLIIHLKEAREEFSEVQLAIEGASWEI